MGARWIEDAKKAETRARLGKTLAALKQRKRTLAVEMPRSDDETRWAQNAYGLPEHVGIARHVGMGHDGVDCWNRQ